MFCSIYLYKVAVKYRLISSRIFYRIVAYVTRYYCLRPHRRRRRRCAALRRCLASAGGALAQQTRNICITFAQCWTSVEYVGPALYKCYANVLCLLGVDKARISFPLPHLHNYCHSYSPLDTRFFVVIAKTHYNSQRMKYEKRLPIL